MRGAAFGHPDDGALTQHPNDYRRGADFCTATRSLTIEITTAYCRQLADLYRRFVLPPAGWGADLEATFALEACRKGNPEGIPILEKKLRDNRVSIPGKEFKP